MNPTFTLAPATTADVLAVLEIINHAKAFLKAAGSTQWQSGYPNADTITTDIANEVGWVLKADHQVVGYAAVIVGEDPNYQEIDGAWQNTTAPYATIHRIAISNQYRGQHLGQRFFKLIIDHFAGGASTTSASTPSSSTCQCNTWLRAPALSTGGSSRWSTRLTRRAWRLS